MPTTNKNRLTLDVYCNGMCDVSSMLVSIVMVGLNDPEGRHVRSSMAYSRYGRAPGVPAAAKIRPLMSRQDVRESWVISLRDVVMIHDLKKQGLSNTAIAGQLGISRRTFERRLKRG